MFIYNSLFFIELFMFVYILLSCGFLTNSKYRSFLKMWQSADRQFFYIFFKLDDKQVNRMYVIVWGSCATERTQPRRLLTITHILFSGAATDGSGTACGFHFGRTVFMNKKLPALLSLTEDCFSGERLLFGSLRQRLRSFLRKLRSFNK